MTPTILLLATGAAALTAVTLTMTVAHYVLGDQDPDNADAFPDPQRDEP